MIKSQVSVIALEKALVTLREGLIAKTLLERDGAIQRFEYSFELCWKLIRKKLLELGRNQVSASPKPLLRDALQEGWIENVSSWFKYLEARNASSHEYEGLTADEVFKLIPEFLAAAVQLADKLKK